MNVMLKDKELTIWEHLNELRSGIVKAGIALLVCSAASIAFAEKALKRFRRSFTRPYGAILVTGHYGSPHVNALKAVAERVGRRTKARIWVLPEYELTKEDIGYRGDHAAKWETSLLMHLRPELVDMSQQPTDPQAKLEGVGGEDPRFQASPELGRTAAEAIEERLAKQALALLAEAE